MNKRVKSAALYEEAKQYFPGGVNSPVRAFKSVGGTPIFIERAQGAYLFDADGNKFIDYSFRNNFCSRQQPKVVMTVTRYVRVASFTISENQIGTVKGTEERNF